MSPRKLYSFWIDDTQASALKTLKRRDGMPESEAIRRALNEWLRRKGVLKADRKRAATRQRS